MKQPRQPEHCGYPAKTGQPPIAQRGGKADLHLLTVKKVDTLLHGRPRVARRRLKIGRTDIHQRRLRRQPRPQVVDLAPAHPARPIVVQGFHDRENTPHGR